MGNSTYTTKKKEAKINQTEHKMIGKMQTIWSPQQSLTTVLAITC